MPRVRMRVETLEREVVAIMREDLSPEAQAEERARIARVHLQDAQEINRAALGRVPAHETFVDGRAEAPLESVKPNGVIVFEFELLGDLLVWIDDALVRHSPVLKGEYQRSHVCLADGIEIENLADPPPASEFVFLNLQPYARKIERGQSPKAPDGVYEGVAALASKRFGNVARIGFGFEEVREGALFAWASKRRPSKTGRTRRQRESSLRKDTRQPAIIIRMG